MKTALYSEIERAIKRGYKTFLCGMAIGFDMICAETVLALKKHYPEIKLIAAIPCRNQDCKWEEKSRKRYRKLLKKADGVRCIYDEYIGAECMIERNRYMVEHSSLLIALYDGTAGGTKSTINYAQTQKREIVILKP